MTANIYEYTSSRLLTSGDENHELPDSGRMANDIQNENLTLTK